MTRPSTPPILSELRSASSPASQVKALRQLKNEVIGHEQKKQMWVGLGVLRHLVRILNRYRADGKKNSRDANGDASLEETKHPRTEEEEAKLEAIIVIGSLAQGGPAFVPPLHASLAIPPLLALLAPSESSPHLVLQTLRALNNIADALCLSTPDQSRTHASLSSLLYVDDALRHLSVLLLQSSSSIIIHQQTTLIAALISKTCREEYHRTLLVQTGVLDALAAKLTGWVAATLGNTSNGKRRPSSNWLNPDGSTLLRNARLSSILHAIGVIIQHSPSRASHLLDIPSLASIFQKGDAHLRAVYERATASLPVGSKATLHSPPTFVEALLPTIQTPNQRSCLDRAIGFPPLDSIKVQSRQSQWPRSLSSAVEIFSSNGLEYVGETESPFVPWLILVSKIFDEVTSLTAVWVLAILYRLRLVKKSRDSAIALLVVPQLVRLLDKDLRISQNALHPFDSSLPTSLSDIIKEEAPAVLAMLTVNNPRTQKCAVEAGAIKRLSQLLKESYDPVAASPSSVMWSSEPSEPNPYVKSDRTSQLGPVGISPAAYHVTKVRETTLVALAALASDKDEYRKAIIENGVIHFIIKTLRAEDVKFTISSDIESSIEDDSEREVIYGNCREPILAACGAARALSRSVSTLRTSLMDAGLTAPLFVLLRCQDMDLKVAATAVICNLVLEFSPMREAVLEGGILKLLCDHAHSNNANLRLNSMWALKHLVVNANPTIKMDCLAELDVSWLRQLISNEPDFPSNTRQTDREDGNGTPIRMSTPNAAGEQVDLLNAVEEDSRESSQCLEEDGDEDLKMSDSVGSLSKGESDLKPRATSTKGLSMLGSSECNLRHHAGPDLPDEIAIVKEGLEFVRNIMMGSNLSEMIDHVFREMGQDELFKILSAKMRPKVLNAFNRDRRSSDNNGVRHIQPQPDILKSSCYILVHIAASHTSHRQQLINQRGLLELIVPLFNHPDQEVRACCAWIVINLTWEDDASDRAACKARARHLMHLGVYEKLEAMENDPDLNCKERCKNALHQMSSLLRLP